MLARFCLGARQAFLAENNGNFWECFQDTKALVQLHHLFETSFWPQVDTLTCKDTQSTWGLTSGKRLGLAFPHWSAALTELTPLLIMSLSNPLSAWQKRLLYSQSIFSKAATESLTLLPMERWALGGFSFSSAHGNGGKVGGDGGIKMAQDWVWK